MPASDSAPADSRTRSGLRARIADRLYYGWIVAVACLLASTAVFGTTYSFSVFFERMLESFPGSRARLSLAFGVRTPTLYVGAAVAGLPSAVFTPAFGPVFLGWTLVYAALFAVLGHLVLFVARSALMGGRRSRWPGRARRRRSGPSPASTESATAATARSSRRWWRTCSAKSGSARSTARCRSPSASAACWPRPRGGDLRRRRRVRPGVRRARDRRVRRRRLRLRRRATDGCRRLSGDVGRSGRRPYRSPCRRGRYGGPKGDGADATGVRRRRGRRARPVSARRVRVSAVVDRRVALRVSAATRRTLSGRARPAVGRRRSTPPPLRTPARSPLTPRGSRCCSCRRRPRPGRSPRWPGG